jgi:hypothetical protein
MVYYLYKIKIKNMNDIPDSPKKPITQKNYLKFNSLPTVDSRLDSSNSAIKIVRDKLIQTVNRYDEVKKQRGPGYVNQTYEEQITKLTQGLTDLQKINPNIIDNNISNQPDENPKGIAGKFKKVLTDLKANIKKHKVLEAQVALDVEEQRESKEAKMVNDLINRATKK